jgi:pyruvate dehydrogenase E1 component beta subunit
MPASVSDARDLLIASTLCADPVIYIDDRWLYSQEEELMPIVELNLAKVGPKRILEGEDVTLVGAGYSVKLCLEAAILLKEKNIAAEVIDIRVLNPFEPKQIVESVLKTGRLLVVDGGWGPSGFAGEVITSVFERIQLNSMKASPRRVTLPFAPAPASGKLEKSYYPSGDGVAKIALEMF